MLTIEQIKALREPFKASAIKTKVQTNPSKTKEEGGKTVGWGVVIFYVDSRDVAERLDLATLGQWSDEYSLFGKALECSLTVAGMTRRDVGEGDKAKDLYSDAFKRAAVKFGVGAFLYRLPGVRCKMQDEGVGGRPRWELTVKAKASLELVKGLAQGGSVGRLEDCMLLSEFQEADDFPVPVETPQDVEAIKAEGDKIRGGIEAMQTERIKPNRSEPIPMAGRQDYNAATDEYEKPATIVRITNKEGETRRATAREEVGLAAAYVPSHPPVPVPPIHPDVPPMMPSQFIGKAMLAARAAGIPADQRPTEASKGDYPMTQEQRRHMMAVLASFEVKKKEPVMSLLSFLLRRKLESSTEISTTEAAGIIKGLSLTDVQAWQESNREEAE